MNSNHPIGIFDSGVGGLSVLQRIRADLPHETLLYVADSGHAPYGDKPAAFITQRAAAITRFLLEQGAKAIVVACNTATAAATVSYTHLDVYKRQTEFPPHTLTYQERLASESPGSKNRHTRHLAR